jgi:GMP synthase-like glutamine amidotransferase
MTKSLLVNCSFSNKIDEDLFAVISQFSECIVTNFDDITLNYQITNDFDAIVISGSAARIVQASDRAKFENVEMLIKNCCVPLLGICFGHQLLCWTFGAEVGSLPKQVAYQFEHVRVIQSNEIFAGFKQGQTIPLSENHYDYVIKDSLGRAGFTLLADSVSCEVEAVKHKTKPLWGVQFHPERITINNKTYPDGHRIIENFFARAVKQ